MILFCLHLKSQLYNSKIDIASNPNTIPTRNPDSQVLSMHFEMHQFSQRKKLKLDPDFDVHATAVRVAAWWPSAPQEWGLGGQLSLPKCK